jgi:hypothetical protein
MDNRVPGGGDGAAWQDALRWGHFDLRRYFTTLIQNFSNRRLPLVNFLGNRNFQFLHARPQRGAVEPQYCGRSFGAADDAVGHPKNVEDVLALDFGQGERCLVGRRFQFRQSDDMFIAQYIASTQDYRALEDVGQFAHMPGQ